MHVFPQRFARRSFHAFIFLVLSLPLANAFAQVLVDGDPNAGGELLYNGLRLPKEWPPRVADPKSRAFHLVSSLPPPAVIPIDEATGKMKAAFTNPLQLSGCSLTDL